MAIKAIVFDCFGVLTTDGWKLFRDTHFHDTPELLEQAHAHNIRVDRGLMSYDDFIHWLADVTDVPLGDVRFQIEGSRPNEQIFTYIRDHLATDYHIGLLSNAGANWLADMFASWQVALFEQVVLSYQLGTTKPDPLMYETIAARLGVLPEECVFIDDQLRYVEGARATGMQAIQYHDFMQMKRELEELLHA